MSKPSPCYKCPERFDGCHGIEPDGTWRCERHRIWKEANAAENAARAAINAVERDVEASKTAMRRAARHAADHS